MHPPGPGSDGREIRMDPPAVRAMLQHYQSLADDLDTLAAQQRQALDAAAAGDGEGFLSGGIDTGHTSVQQIRTAAADLRQLIQNVEQTVQQFEQVDTEFAMALGLPGIAPGMQTRLPGLPPATVGVDEYALAMLAYRLGEQGRSQAEIDRLVEAARLSQLQRALEAFETRDFAQELADAELLEAAAQAQLDHFIDRELVSALTPTDTDLARYLAWLGVQQARAAQAAVLADWVQATETELAYLTLLRQRLDPADTPVGTRAEWDARIADLQVDLDGGDPGIAAQIAELEAALVQLEINPPSAHGRVRARHRQRIEDEIAALQAADIGLRTQLATAQESVTTATTQLDAAGLTLQASVEAYQAELAAELPARQDALARLRAESALDPMLTPELIAALDGVEQALPSRDPTVLQAALDQLDAVTIPGNYGNAWITSSVHNLLRGDPRLDILAGRAQFARQEAHPWVDELVLDLVTLGIGPLVVNHQKLNEPGGSDELYQDLRSEQAVNAALLLVGFLGPLGAAGKQGLKLSDEAIETLRAAGYSDEMITAATRAATAGHADVATLQNLVHTTDADDLLVWLQNHVDEMARFDSLGKVPGGGGKIVTTHERAQAWFDENYANQPLGQIGPVAFGQKFGLSFELTGADEDILKAAFDTLDYLVEHDPDVATTLLSVKVLGPVADYPQGGKFTAFAAAVPSSQSRSIEEFWLSEQLMRDGRLASPQEILDEAGQSVAFPTAGADTVNIPAVIAHEYGHAKQRWLEVDNEAAKALRGDLDRLITNHEATLRTVTPRSFDYEPASLIPREVFAELYAARHVLDLADGGKLAEDLVHPALRDPAMQPVLAEFERILKNATP